jgi:hypothetical protein
MTNLRLDIAVRVTGVNMYTKAAKLRLLDIAREHVTTKMRWPRAIEMDVIKRTLQLVGHDVDGEPYDEALDYPEGFSVADEGGIAVLDLKE